MKICSIELYFDGARYSAIAHPPDITGIGKCPQEALMDISERLAILGKGRNVLEQEDIVAIDHWLRFDNETISECLERLRGDSPR